MLRKYSLLLCSVIAASLFTAGIVFLYFQSAASKANNYVQTVSEVHSPADTGSKDKPGAPALETKPGVRTAFNILLLIPDKISSSTDVMMLFNYTPSTRKISLLSIPRDTLVDIDTSIPKINSVYGSKGNSEKLYNILGGLLGIKPDYYVYVDIKGFRKIIDTLGGVDFNIPVDIDYDDPTQDLSIHFKKGQQHLNGKKAEEFLRYRKTMDNHYSGEMLKYYDGSDTKRSQMQIRFLSELLKQKANLVTLTKVNKILDITAKNVRTDMPLDVIFNLSKGILSTKDFDMNSFRISGRDRYINKIYYYEYNGKIINTGINETTGADEVLKEYFTTFRDTE